MYQDLFAKYKLTTDWADFCDMMKESHHRQTLLAALADGWIKFIRKDLIKLYNPLDEELSLFLIRMQSLATFNVNQPSAAECLIQLGSYIDRVNVLRGYLRQAYYVKLDEPDDIVSILDEALAEVGSGTPTKEECSTSYQKITLRYGNSDMIVINGNLADELADILAGQFESLYRSLESLVMPSLKEEILIKLIRVNDLHIQLTSKSLIDVSQIDKLIR